MLKQINRGLASAARGMCAHPLAVTASIIIVKRTGLKPRSLLRFTIQKLAGKASIAKPRALARG